MLIPDVNVLLSAFRADLPHHETALLWLRDTLERGGEVGLLPPILTSLIRISTHAKVWEEPAKLSEVLEFTDFLVEHGVTIQPTPDYWKIFKRLLEQTGATGNLVTDASYAATAIGHEAFFVSFDKDFGKFPGLRLITL